MGALAPVAPRLAKLIPRLATDHDGEVVATVRAIERTLRAAGLDFHTFAASIDKDSTPLVSAEPNSWVEIARWCRDHDRGLPAKEREFIRDMSARLVCGGSPSEKQANWLRAIYARLKATYS